MKVFLGGTVNGSQWRETVIPRLKIAYYNPEVEEWNQAAYEQELYEREHCSYCLYVLTPRMEGFYALAEVIDDSYKKTDKTIFCYLEHDADSTFTPSQVQALEAAGKLIVQNGAIWKKSLEEVIDFLNSAQHPCIEESEGLKNVFISYGRRHSLSFAKTLYERLTALHYTVWFDMNDIPLGVDFQEQIDSGIETAENFVFLISPHSVKSVYCRKEIELAVKHHKRIIPILHVYPSDCENLIHPEIAKRNWIYFDREDNFEHELARFLQLLALHKDYVLMHTVLLQKALLWERNKRSAQLLVVGKDREAAEEWLKMQEFFDSSNRLVQAPCEPSLLQAEYICESRKNSHNLMCDVFVAYDLEDKRQQEQIIAQLTLNGISTWLHTKDIRKGSNYEYAIHEGVESADVFLFLMSPRSLASDYCRKEFEYACSINKRILPILIDDCPSVSAFHPQLEKLQYIDFTHIQERVVLTSVTNENVHQDVEARKEKSDFEKRIDGLISHLNKDKTYYQQHKILLVQAFKWQRQKENDSILLRGYNLENAKAFLKMGESKMHPPTELHKAFIHQSELKAGTLRCEVFISYSRTDSDFARQLNEQLQLTGKTTWFDQESIALGADFQQEIYRGIEQSDNFLFVISPDAVQSPYCADEVEYAKGFNKRFMSVLLRKTTVESLPASLAAVQWIDFTSNDFGKSFTELVRTLDTDREHVSQHTRWLQRAIEWETLHKKTESLLRGDELVLAGEWLKKAADKKPAPTALQTEYIKQSTVFQQNDLKRQKKQIARLRILLVAASILLMISVIMTIYARKAINEKIKSDENNFEKFRKNGDDSYQAKQYALAYTNYDAALSLNPKRTDLKTKIDTCKLLAIKQVRFDSLINQGDRFKENEDTYMNALQSYQEAFKLDINNELVSPKISTIQEKIAYLVTDYAQRTRYLIAANTDNSTKFATDLMDKIQVMDSSFKDLRTLRKQLQDSIDKKTKKRRF